MEENSTETKHRGKTADILTNSRRETANSTDNNEARKPVVFQEVYPLQEPYVYAAIAKEKDKQKMHYQIISQITRLRFPDSDKPSVLTGHSQTF